MILKHKAQTPMPEYRSIPEPHVKTAVQEIVRLLQYAFKDIYADLVSIVPEAVDALPTASADYYQRFMLKRNSGADDTLHICIYDGAAAAYKWQQVTLS